MEEVLADGQALPRVGVSGLEPAPGGAVRRVVFGVVRVSGFRADENQSHVTDCPSSPTEAPRHVAYWGVPTHASATRLEAGARQVRGM